MRFGHQVQLLDAGVNIQPEARTTTGPAAAMRAASGDGPGAASPRPSNDLDYEGVRRGDGLREPIRGALAGQAQVLPAARRNPVSDGTKGAIQESLAKAGKLQYREQRPPNGATTAKPHAGTHIERGMVRGEIPRRGFDRYPHETPCSTDIPLTNRAETGAPVGLRLEGKVGLRRPPNSTPHRTPDFAGAPAVPAARNGSPMRAFRGN
jgi:hypothetical protein